MKTAESFDINDVPAEVFQEIEAERLPTDILVAEVEKRGLIVKRPLSSPVTPRMEYNEATGTMTDGNRHYDVDTGKEVTPAEAYERASGGW